MTKTSIVPDIFKDEVSRVDNNMKIVRKYLMADKLKAFKKVLVSPSASQIMSLMGLKSKHTVFVIEQKFVSLGLLNKVGKKYELTRKGENFIRKYSNKKFKIRPIKSA